MNEPPIDKSTWGAGPWQQEPDRVEFEHAGFPCLLRRSPLGGHWCGYAAVPPGHPDHGLHYSDVDVDVHGGLTYASACDGEICHVPKPGEPDDVYWFGFDCGHYLDILPAMEARDRLDGFERLFQEPRVYRVYRDLAYAMSETKQLAEQLARRLKFGQI